MLYRISKYDPIDELNPNFECEWIEVAVVDTLSQVKPIVRELRSQGYDSVSMAVDKIDEEKFVLRSL